MKQFNDLGVSLDYKLFENLTLDGQIFNGEGYKKTQDGDGLMKVIWRNL